MVLIIKPGIVGDRYDAIVICFGHLICNASARIINIFEFCFTLTSRGCNQDHKVNSMIWY